MNTQRVDPEYAASGGLDYYEGPDIVDTLLHALREAELDPKALDIDDLASLDEFHALGRASRRWRWRSSQAYRRTPACSILALESADRPGFLAARYRARVTALDATLRFCRAAELLTQGAGLADRVTVVCGDALALPFADASFDLAWSQAW